MSDNPNSPQSFMVGHDVQGQSARNVYEALRDIECEGCGGTISEGQMFTRHKMQGGGPALYPMCQTCEPFTRFEPLAPDKRPPKPGQNLKQGADSKGGYGSMLGSL